MNKLTKFIRAALLAAPFALLVGGEPASAATCGPNAQCINGIATLNNALGTNWTTLYASASPGNGAKIDKILCAAPAALPNSVVLFFSILRAGVNHALFSNTAPSVSGLPTAAGSTVDMLTATTNGIPSFSSLPNDENGNPIIRLQAGDTLQVHVGTTIASGTLDCTATGNQY